MRRAAKVDANHGEIVRVLRGAGAKTLSLARLGSGTPDLLINYAGRLHLVEIKGRTGRLRASQRKFQEEFGHVYVVRSTHEAISLLTQLRGSQ
jgi:hypothetical protein